VSVVLALFWVAVTELHERVAWTLEGPPGARTGDDAKAEGLAYLTHHLRQEMWLGHDMPCIWMRAGSTSLLRDGDDYSY
jgi:hypothetical protein